MSNTAIAEVLKSDRDALVEEWFNELPANLRRADIDENMELRQQCTEFLGTAAAAADFALDSDADAWTEARQFVARFANQRAKEGFSPSDTVRFVLALKAPLCNRLRARISDTDEAFDTVTTAWRLLDQLGLLLSDSFITSREAVIARQQDEMLELSTPVVMLSEGVLALPLIGTLDSGRAQVVMETLLQRIVATEAEIAIIDITGVPTVDTLVAQQLMKAVTAAGLMGVECIVSGIRPQIAQTIVQLGVGLGDVATKATLKDAFQLALSRLQEKQDKRARWQV